LDQGHSDRHDVLSWLRVALVAHLPARALRALLGSFGTPDALLGASARDIAGVAGREAAHALARGADPALLEATLAWLEGANRHLVALGDPRYPPRLLQTADPPAVLYAAGRVELLAAPALAIVGSRNASTQGIGDAEALARALSEAGLTIVSGLALGIDAAAHRGGLAARGSSVAVMGTGPDVYYPSRNRDLAAALERDGCLVSEFPLGTPPRPGNFPCRNRLISGMSLGVLVVEAALPSGSLTTARSALEQDREVFAMPGSIHSTLSKGCHWLIKQGAKLVEGAEDVLAELRWEPPSPPAAAQGPAAERPAAERDPVLRAMGFAPMSLDQIAEQARLDVARVSARVSRLEIEGRVAALPGGMFQRVSRA
jgi:DNA processing protein